MVTRDVAFAGKIITERISYDPSIRWPNLDYFFKPDTVSTHLHPKEWPPQVELVNKWELPSVLTQRYSAAGDEGISLCGIFPDIRRAWAAVNNSLFLWRFDKWNGQCPEYSAGEEPICAVGLANSKPGVFVDSIQYLLVLATPVELILVGVCCSGSTDKRDPYSELFLQPLPDYKVLSDGVAMTCITCTNEGRIFLAGRDGHIYELQYNAGSFWQKRCRKVCLTSDIGSAILRWAVPGTLRSRSGDPIVEMLVDNGRKILYSRTKSMKIQVLTLGKGEAVLKTVTDERNLIDTSIVSLSILSTVESHFLPLVGVLSDGRSIYFVAEDPERPYILDAVLSRPFPPLRVTGALGNASVSLVGHVPGNELSVKVEASYYSAGILILSDSSPLTGSSLIIVSKNYSTQSCPAGNFGTISKRKYIMRESVSFLPVEGRMLFAADVLPLPDTAAMLHSLYSRAGIGVGGLGESLEKASARLWGRGDLTLQHMLPRRRVIVFSTEGMMELVFNRPVDILRRLLTANSPRAVLEDFYDCFGAVESAAMCLMLAANIADEESFIGHSVVDKAAEAYENPRFVGIPQCEGSSRLLTTITAAGGFSMGHVIEEAEPVFSAAYESLCLCITRLLYPLWNYNFMDGKYNTDFFDKCGSYDIVCRISVRAMEILENKLRLLEKFLRLQKVQRRGLYARVAGLEGLTGSVFHSSSPSLEVGDMNMPGDFFKGYSRNLESADGVGSDIRQLLSYSPAERSAMEVRETECLRQLLLRSSEALFLLQLLHKHHVTHVPCIDVNFNSTLLNMSFHDLVCSEEGHMIATSLIVALMECYPSRDGRGTVDDIRRKLLEGCPSYFKESDSKFYFVMECLERAAVSTNIEERENLARDAYNFFNQFPESADLRTICRKFENLRFYEAVVGLPLQKAQTLDPAGIATNERDQATKVHVLARCEQCYEIIAIALRNLIGEASQSELSDIPARSFLDKSSQKKYIRQIVQLAVRSPDRIFLDYFYRTMIDLSLENELLEFAGPDLVRFLEHAISEPRNEAHATPSSGQASYLHLLARYYVINCHHLLAARVLLRLAERRSKDRRGLPSLEERYDCLCSAVLQAKSVVSNRSSESAPDSIYDYGLLDLLEEKLAVARIQIKVKEEHESLASRLEARAGTSVPGQNEGTPNSREADLASLSRQKVKELSLELKSITQLYNDYAVPSELWEVCLEMLYFASSPGDADSKVMRETWVRLMDQSLSRGGITEACAVIKKVGARLYPGNGAMLPVDTLCLHLEKAALERCSSLDVCVGDGDIPRALVSACKGAAEPVLNAYDHLLSNGAKSISPMLRLRLLSSVLVILRDWVMSISAQRFGKTAVGTSPLPERFARLNQEIRYKITSAANRYGTEVQSLPLTQSQTETVCRGFAELEETLNSAHSFQHLQWCTGVP